MRALAFLCLCLFAAAAQAGAPDAAPPPPPRPDMTPGEALALRARIGGDIAFLVVDLDSGEALEAMAPDDALPPASVAKIATSLYALERLRPDHRFETRVVANGGRRGGLLEGDLILQGGGDPELDTAGLDDLAAQLAEGGLTAVLGRFLVDPGPDPVVERIDPTQPEYVGYNPSVSSLNLNFNRARAEWERGKNGYAITVEARSDRLSAPTDAVRLNVVDATTAGAPLDYAMSADAELWTASRRALGKKGGRWLPVRRSAVYAGEVFRDLAARRGLKLPPPVVERTPLIAEILARRESRPLGRILYDMMRYSTNLTAEAVGLAATRATGGAPEDLAASAREMTAWARDFSGAENLYFTNHSGLGGDSAASPQALVRLLKAADSRGFPALGGGRALTFRGLLQRKNYALRSRPSPRHEAVVLAKTGTLNFVSALAGYIDFAAGRRLAFAILSTNPEKRLAAVRSGDESPRGARRYARRARAFQTMLLRSWITRFGAAQTQ